MYKNLHTTFMLCLSLFFQKLKRFTFTFNAGLWGAYSIRHSEIQQGTGASFKL